MGNSVRALARAGGGGGRGVGKRQDRGSLSGAGEGKSCWDRSHQRIWSKGVMGPDFYLFVCLW